MLGYTWADLNRPRQKMPAVVAFSDRFAETAIYRRNDNMQCGSGIREHLGQLLDDQGVNRWGCLSAAALYQQLGDANG